LVAEKEALNVKVDLDGRPKPGEGERVGPWFFVGRAALAQ